MRPNENGNISFTGIPGSGNFMHAYIVWGGSETDRTSFATNLAAAIICLGDGQKPCGVCVHCDKAFRHIHPDIIIIDRNQDAKEIYVDQIRALREDAVILPNEAAKKIYIIRHAGAMNTPAQNAILKLLEEPPACTSFILTSENAAELLPTVRSRCVELSADKHHLTDQVSIRDDAAAFYQALNDGPLKFAELSFTLEKTNKKDFADFLDDAKTLLVLKLKEHHTGGAVRLTSDYLMKAVNVLDRAKEYLDSNVSLGHITGMICAELLQR